MTQTDTHRIMGRNLSHALTKMFTQACKKNYDCQFPECKGMIIMSLKTNDAKKVNKVNEDMNLM